jgi:acyl-coenzyme A thioesterase PaaI-like protein
MATLADAVRRWVALTVSNRAPAEEAARAAAALHALADGFDRHVPDPPPPTTHMAIDEERADEGPETLAERLAYDVVIGRYSPLALPLTLSFDPPRALGRGRFTLPYEGPPGCVHGAVLVASFDIVLTAANLIAGAGGPTVRLSAHYRRPTRLHDEVVLEGWVTRVEDRRIFSEGRLVQNGVVTVEAEGEFATIDRSRTMALADEQAGGRPPATEGTIRWAP